MNYVQKLEDHELMLRHAESQIRFYERGHSDFARGQVVHFKRVRADVMRSIAALKTPAPALAAE